MTPDTPPPETPEQQAQRLARERYEALQQQAQRLARERSEALPIGHTRFGGRRIAQDPNYADLDRRSGVVTRGQQ